MRIRVLLGSIVSMANCVACSDDNNGGAGFDASPEAVDAGDAAIDAGDPTSTTETSGPTTSSFTDAGSGDVESSQGALTNTTVDSNDTTTSTQVDGSIAAPADAGTTSDPVTSTEPLATSSTSSTATSSSSGQASLSDDSSSPKTTDEVGDAGDDVLDATDTNDDADTASDSDDPSDADTTSDSVAASDSGDATNLDASTPDTDDTTIDTGTTDTDTGTTDTDTSTDIDTSTDSDDSDPIIEAGSADADADIFDSGLPDAGEPAPTLTSLQIQGGQYALKPAFDPAIKRYSVVATSDSEVLALTATGSAGAPLLLNGQPLTDGQNVSLDDVDPGDDITITIGDESSSSEYTIKYLPPSFPNMVVTQSEPGASHDPVYATINVPGGNYAVKLDNNGVPFFATRSDSRLFDFKKHPNGLLSYALWTDPNGAGVEQILLDSDFNEVDRLAAVGLVNTDFHEFMILPNGNFVFLSYERITRDLTAFGGGAAVEVKDSVFQEVTPDLSQVLFQWNSWQYFDYDDSVYALTPTDYAHLNTVFVDDDENWLVSSRGFSQVLKLNRTTGAVIWRLGGVNSDFTYINDPFEGPCGQHTPSRLDNGHILIFDNGRDCLPDVQNGRNGQTRIIEYELDEDNMTAELVWSYTRAGEEAVSQGSAQRLDNGNTFIGWGDGPSLLATEVTPEGDVVFEIEAQPATGSSNSYRARRFAD